MRLSFSGEEEYDELLDSAGFGIWLVLSGIAGAYVLLSVTPNPQQAQTLQFFYFMVILSAAIFVPMMDRFEPTEGPRMLQWALIGFVGLLVSAFVTNIFVSVARLTLTGGTPLMLTNYLQLNVLSSGLTFTTLFGTLYFVATGEEGLKALGTIFFNILPPVDWFTGLTESLAAQPLMWIIVSLWAVAHVIIGQNPPWYSIVVFADGLWLLHCTSKGGTWLTAIIAHFANNSFFLGATLLTKLLGVA